MIKVCAENLRKLRNVLSRWRIHGEGRRQSRTKINIYGTPRYLFEKHSPVIKNNLSFVLFKIKIY